MKFPMRAQFCGLCLLPALLLGCGTRHMSAPAPSRIQTQHGITATLDTTPAPPHTGDDVLNLTLADASGAPVGDANVTATANMLSPRLPGNAVTGRSQGNGQYQIPVRLGVATRYTVDITVQRIGSPALVFSFPLEAQQ